MDKKPNIIFLMVDQLSAKWLEANEDICPTPNLDRLASMGTTYNNAFTNNPICCSARATIATGLTSRGHGVIQNGYELSPNIPTFMQSLKNNGWKTSAFGKVHLKPHYDTAYPDYTPYGFDTCKITEDIRAGEWLDWIEAEYPDYYNQALATIWDGGIPEFQAYGKNKINLSELCSNIRKDFNWATADFPQNSASCYTLPFPTELSQTEWITKNAIDFIETSSDNNPLYMHISYVQPHAPQCPPSEYIAQVKTENIPAPIESSWTDDPNHPSCFDSSPGTRRDKNDWLNMRQYYYADIAHLDKNIGTILNSLEKANRLDNTYIIFLADHGDLLFDHGFTGKGERHYDACIRIPLIICGTGFKQNHICQDFVTLEDIFPTVLDIADISLPKLPCNAYASESNLPSNFYPGKSLFPNSTRPTFHRSFVYIESYNNIDTNTPLNWARTIRTSKWRYTFYPSGGGEQLFDLEIDRNELKNLAFDLQYSKIRQELKSQLVEAIILQDYPHSPNNLHTLCVH